MWSRETWPHWRLEEPTRLRARRGRQLAGQDVGRDPVHHLSPLGEALLRRGQGRCRDVENRQVAVARVQQGIDQQRRPAADIENPGGSLRSQPLDPLQ